MKTSELITQAKQYLWDGKNELALETPYTSEYICFAVLHAARDANGSYNRNVDLANRVRGLIEERIFPWNNLEAWLQHSVGICSSVLTYQRVQKHRLKWMNRLIKEHKAKGD